MQGRNAAPWQRNRVGPYRLLRRLRSTSTGQGAGRAYLAWATPSGRPALVVAPAAPEHYVPQEEYRFRVRAGVQPAPYVALEVEEAPHGRAPLAQLADGMDAICEVLERYARHPEAHAHLSTTPSPRRRSAQGPLWAAGAAVVLAVLVCLPRVWQGETHPPAAPALEAAASMAEEALTEPEALPVGSMEGRAPWALALDMPPKPFRGQYRVDKEGKCKGRREVPINGGCWIELAGRAPCGDDAYEWKGACYWPSMPAAKEPSSTLPRPPPVPAQRAQ